MSTKRKKVKSSRKVSTRPTPVEDRSINIGDISGGTGIAIGNGAQSNILQVNSQGNDEISHLFHLLIEKAAILPDGPEKAIAYKAIKELESEARKGDQADENTIQKWMMFLSETAPDVWEVAVDTLIHPVKGIGTVFKKIAKRAKAGGNAQE